MKEKIKEFGGAIFLYSVIIIMIIAINSRFKELNKIDSTNLAYIEVKE